MPSGVSQSIVRSLVTVDRVRNIVPVFASWNTTGW
ncbi:hypothetical protein FHR72_003570 [Mycolicibacterium iranicum]|uniref:Uncharacterized protein n=1 Tax=Mycolicibacterium iranicum TaxID=912594 RepID=A0A839QB76_MYCIR|nr:hypothetical protein [Mycolicibacterium iranicum]